MEKIGILLRAMLLDVMGSALVAGEGILAIQREILNRGHDFVRSYAKDAAEELLVSTAVSEDEKDQVRSIMERAQVLAVGEEEVSRVLAKLEELGLVTEVPPPEPACELCDRLMVDTDLSFCSHPDAEGVAGTTENTGYVLGVQPRKQPSWCPLLKGPKEADPPATENSSDSLDPAEKPEE